MSIHRVSHKSFTMPDGNEVEIKYWSDGKRMCLAAFDKNDKQVSSGQYCFEAEDGDSFLTQMKETVMDSLGSTIEADLKNNPEIHYKP